MQRPVKGPLTKLLDAFVINRDDNDVFGGAKVGAQVQPLVAGEHLNLPQHLPHHAGRAH